MRRGCRIRNDAAVAVLSFFENENAYADLDSLISLPAA